MKWMLFERVKHCLGPPLNWGFGANCHCWSLSAALTWRTQQPYKIYSAQTINVAVKVHFKLQYHLKNWSN